MRSTAGNVRPQRWDLLIRTWGTPFWPNMSIFLLSRHQKWSRKLSKKWLKWVVGIVKIEVEHTFLQFWSFLSIFVIFWIFVILRYTNIRAFLTGFLSFHFFSLFANRVTYCLSNFEVFPLFVKIDEKLVNFWWFTFWTGFDSSSICYRLIFGYLGSKKGS